MTIESTTLNHPHRTPAKQRRKEITKFLLIGSERSGSTMLRLMLDHHTQLSCMFDSDFMVTPYDHFSKKPLPRFAEWLEENWHFRHSGLVFPSQAESYEDVIEDFFQQRGRISGKELIGATIHHNFHSIPTLFPQTRCVHLLRDGRPVAASIVQMGWAGNLYCAASRWRQTMEQIETLRQRVGMSQWLEVRYEDLLTDPEAWLGKICEFLGITYSDRMLSYHEDSTYSPVDPANADRWRKKLSPREIYLAEMAAGDALERAGYTRIFPPAQPGWLERMAIRLHGRIARARFNINRYGAYLVITRKLWRLLGIRRPALEQRYAALRKAHIK